MTPTAVQNANCACGKVTYVSRREALVYAKHMPGKQQRAYRCDAGCWHLTTRTKQSKTHMVEGSKVPDALKLTRAHRAERRAAQRRAAKAQVTVTPITAAPSKRQPRHTGPEHTSCSVCKRRWLSDLNPEARRCPGCGTVGSIVIGWADRARNYIRSVAA